MLTEPNTATASPQLTSQQHQQLDFDKMGGLLPAIVQHAESGAVLMLGYMNAEALAVTEQTGRVTFYSRSKQRLWTKGESSGHFLSVAGISADCDHDTLLIQAIPHGPTCHLGCDSCFRDHQHQWHFLYQLEQLVEQRKTASAASSYTARLYASGIKRISQKVGEEGVETALAAVAGDKDELINETSDLVYHLLVLLHASGLDLGDVIENLRMRGE